MQSPPPMQQQVEGHAPPVCCTSARVPKRPADSQAGGRLWLWHWHWLWLWLQLWQRRRRHEEAAQARSAKPARTEGANQTREGRPLRVWSLSRSRSLLSLFTLAGSAETIGAASCRRLRWLRSGFARSSSSSSFDVPALLSRAHRVCVVCRQSSLAPLFGAQLGARKTSEQT